jgi:hypothetical protein
MADYAFEITAQQWSRDSYYVSSSRPVIRVTVVASTQADAVTEAKRMLGDPERSRYWRIGVGKAIDVRLAGTNG